MRSSSGWLLIGIAILAASALLAGPVRAACDLIAQSQQAFRAPLGTVNRPFASPGDVVEINVRTALCDRASSGLLPEAEDHVVTVFFQPASDVRRRAVVLTDEDCASPEMEAKLAACTASLGRDGSTTCVRVNQPGDPPGLALVDRIDGPHLTFRFPDTDGLYPPDGDLWTLAGPAAIAVTRGEDPLPCDIARVPCGAQEGLIACIDQLFEADGSCEPNVDPTFPSFTALPPPNDYQKSCFADDPPCDASEPSLRMTIDGAGNLLVPMSWRGVLVNQPGLAIPRLLRGTLKPPVPLRIPSAAFLTSHTPEGASLPPIFEPQLDPEASDQNVITLFGSVDAPASVLRIARHRGRCEGGPADGVACASSRDCGGDTCVSACTGGSKDGLVCAKAGDCPGGRCGELYDAGELQAIASVGPALRIDRATDAICQLEPHQLCSSDAQCGMDNPCVSYALEASLAVSLESVTAASERALGLVVRESAAARDVTGDGDQVDVAVTLRDRQTGAVQSLGAPDGYADDAVPLAGCGLAGVPDGRAVLEVNRPPFRFAAVASEGALVAFLESEAREGYCDINADHDRGDGILRVFELGGAEASAAISPPRSADAMPRVDGHSLAVSGGRVFFRTSEAAMARLEATVVSLAPGGTTPSEGASFRIDLSPDGRFVVFTSSSDELLGPGADTNATSDVFLRDRVLGSLERVSLTDAGGEATGESRDAKVSADGRFVAFWSWATDLIGPGADTNAAPDAFLRDRCIADGVPVPGCTPSTERVSVTSAGGQANGGSAFPHISADARFVTFFSEATDLLGPAPPPGPGDPSRVFIRDRCSSYGIAVPGCTPSTELVSVGLPFTPEASAGGAMSTDGRFVLFASETSGPSVTNFYVRDRVHGTTELVSIDELGNPADDPGGALFLGIDASISSDGRYVAFTTNARLDPAIPVGPPLYRLFVRDRLLGITEGVSVDIAGAMFPQVDVPDPGVGYGGAIARGGRHVIFQARRSDVFGGPAAPLTDVFVRDRVAGTVERVSTASGGGVPAAGGGRCLGCAISDDGTVFGFFGDDGLVPPGIDDNAALDVFVRTADPSDPLGIDALLFADGRLDDVVLEVLDTNAPSPTLTTLCPAEDVAVADGKALFLRPESAAGAGACPGGSLNDPPDSDTSDLVVQFWPGSGPVQNQGLAGTAVAMSQTTLAALVSEAGQGEVLNGDGDDADDVVHVRDVSGGAWTNVGQAADSVRVCGAAVVFITSEIAQNQVLNGDGLIDDRVLQIYNPATDELVPVGLAAEDFVCGDRLLAFRTRESAQGVNLNADGGDLDTADDVLMVWDLADPACLSATPPSSCLYESGTAVRSCNLQACDPRNPYRVGERAVKFLTFECEQGGTVIAGTPACPAPGGTDLDGDDTADDLILQVLDFDARMILPITRVSPSDDTDPLRSDEEGTVLVSTGRCIESLPQACVVDADCGAGEHCLAGTCARDHRACLSDGDCPSDVSCDAAERNTQASPDTDGDAVPDHVDNCPYVANDGQADDDGDGAGNACDLATCGNGSRESGELCEAGDEAQCAGPCSACRCACANAVADPKAKVVVTTRRGLGRLTATMELDLASYDGGEPVRVHLSDTDSEVIAEQSVGALAKVGPATPPKTWRFKTRSAGVQQVQLKSLAPRKPGKYKLVVKASKWLSAAAANQPAAGTTLTVSIGGQCFSRAVTRKSD